MPWKIIVKDGTLFKTFYIGHPEVVENDRVTMVKNIFDMVEHDIGLSSAELRESRTGFTADDAYIRNLAIYKPIANELGLDQNFTKEICLWDLGHECELTLDDAKLKTHKWLVKYDADLTAMLIHLRDASIAMH